MVTVCAELNYTGPCAFFDDNLNLKSGQRHETCFERGLHMGKLVVELLGHEHVAHPEHERQVGTQEYYYLFLLKFFLLYQN